MRVQCPKCDFSGNIRDELIPPEGKQVNCPKCKTRFFVKREEAPEAPLKNHLPVQKKSPGKQINIFVAIAGFVVCIGLGILIGTQLNKTEKPMVAEAPPQPQENTRNPVEIEEATPPPPTSVPKKSDYVSDEYVDDFTIEATIAKTENMTSVQKEEFLYKAGLNFIKKNIRGDFTVLDVLEMSNMYENLIPAGMYTHLIYAKSSDTDDSNFYVYIGTNNMELVHGISKDARIYLEGYAINASVTFSTYYFFIVNAKIEFL